MEGLCHICEQDSLRQFGCVGVSTDYENMQSNHLVIMGSLKDPLLWLREIPEIFMSSGLGDRH